MENTQYTIISKRRQEEIETESLAMICAEALDRQCGKLLQEANFYMEIKDYKRFGYTMYQLGRHGERLERLRDELRDQSIPNFISKDTKKSFPEL